MTLALRRYPRFIQPYRYARNGFVPEAPMARRLINGQNHLMAYRRKTVLTANATPPGVGVSGTNGRYYSFYHSGYGATHLGYVIGMMLDNTSTGADPSAAIKNTLVGGGSASAEIHAGNFNGTPADGPDDILWRTGRIAITPNTDNYIDVVAADYARIQSVLCYEIASDVVTGATDYFIEESPSVEFPIWDSIRQKHAEGLSNMWKHNAGHLMGWYGPGAGAAPTYATTTWTNVIDTSTSVTSSTAGYYIGDGDQTIEPWLRVSSTGLECVLAVRCSVTGSATGEVRLQNSTGTLASITGMGTADNWYTTPVTLSNGGDLGAMAKCDLQARTSNASNTMTLKAAVLYAYLA